MKKKLTLCFLAFALILSCATAMAAKINDAKSEGAAGVEITKKSDQTVEVKYAGQKDKEYVIMAVSKDGVDDSAGRPTKDTIGTNQEGVVVYMDQAKGGADGSVNFTVHPNLDSAKAGDEYYLYISTNASGEAMTKIGSFTIDEVLELIGDVNGDDKVNSSDITALVNLIISGKELTENQTLAADSNRDGKVNSSDITALVNLIIKG